MFGRIFENVVAILLAAMVVIGFLAYFGTTPVDRTYCDATTGDPAHQISCIIRTSLN